MIKTDKKYNAVLWGGVVLLIVDLIIKLIPDFKLEIIRGLFILQNVKNVEGSFSLFNLRTSLMLSVVSLTLIIWNTSKSADKKEKIGYYLILGGGIENFIERIIFKTTTDFIVLKNIGYANLSDLVIFVGLLFIVIAFLCPTTQKVNKSA